MPAQIFLLPVIVLVCWTLVIWCWLYATRIPAMKTAKIHPQQAQDPRGEWREKLPDNVGWVADNYNHLHEQPTTFYVLIFAIYLMELASPFALWLAWAYVMLRIAHSFIQIFGNKVLLRFGVFFISGALHIALAVSAVVALL